MLRRTRMWGGLAPALVLVALAGCGGDDDGGNDGKGNDGADKAGRAVSDSFVGTIGSNKAFVAVVAAPPAEGQEKRSVNVYVCDAARLCEWYSGSSAGNDFTAASESGGESKGTLSRKAAKGTIQPAGGDELRYRAARATAAAGVYELDVARDGRLKGASASGVGLTGKSPLPNPGSGSIKLADGTRVKVNVTSKAGDPIALDAGKARLIILDDGKLRGAARSRPVEGGEAASFFIRSSK
jgi:hypothetical protein